MTPCKIMKIDLYLSPRTNIYHKWINVHLKLGTLNLKEEKTGTEHGINDMDDFLCLTPIAQAPRPTVKNWDLMTIKIFCMAKDTIIQMRWLSTEL